MRPGSSTKRGDAPFPMLGRERGLGKGSGFRNWSGVPEPVIAARDYIVGRCGLQPHLSFESRAVANRTYGYRIIFITFIKPHLPTTYQDAGGSLAGKDCQDCSSTVSSTVSWRAASWRFSRPCRLLSGVRPTACPLLRNWGVRN